MNKQNISRLIEKILMVARWPGGWVGDMGEKAKGLRSMNWLLQNIMGMSNTVYGR